MDINAGAGLRRDSPSLGMQAWRTTAAPTKVLILQSDFKAAQTLADLLAERGNPVWQALST